MGPMAFYRTSGAIFIRASRYCPYVKEFQSWVSVVYQEAERRGHGPAMRRFITDGDVFSPGPDYFQLNMRIMLFCWPSLVERRLVGAIPIQSIITHLEEQLDLFVRMAAILFLRHGIALRKKFPSAACVQIVTDSRFRHRKIQSVSFGVSKVRYEDPTGCTAVACKATERF